MATRPQKRAREAVASNDVPPLPPLDEARELDANIETVSLACPEFAALPDPRLRRLLVALHTPMPDLRAACIAATLDYGVAVDFLRLPSTMRLRIAVAQAIGAQTDRRACACLDLLVARIAHRMATDLGYKPSNVEQQLLVVSRRRVTPGSEFAGNTTASTSSQADEAADEIGALSANLRNDAHTRARDGAAGRSRSTQPPASDGASAAPGA